MAALRLSRSLALFLVGGRFVHGRGSTVLMLPSRLLLMSGCPVAMLGTCCVRPDDAQVERQQSNERSGNSARDHGTKTRQAARSSKGSGSLLQELARPLEEELVLRSG